MEYRMAKLTLYHAAPSRSSNTRWMLEEIGEPYDIRLLNLSKGENRGTDYLAVNPMGKVPALKHGDTVITEPAIMDRAFPRKEEARRAALGYGDFETVMDVVANAMAKGPHLMGEQFTAADVVIGSTLRW